MKHLMGFFTASLLLVPWIGGAVEIQSDVLQYEKSLESKLETHLVTFFGTDSKLRVNVRVHKKTPVSPVNKAQDVSPAEDMGYIPFPTMPGSQNGGQNPYEGMSSFEVENVQVELQAGTDTPDQIVTSAKEVIDRTLSEIPHQTLVTRIKTDQADRDLASDDEPPKVDTEKHGLEKWKELFQPLAILGSALIVLLGLILFGKGMSSTVRVMLEGGQSINQKTKIEQTMPTAGAEPMAAAAPVAKEESRTANKQSALVSDEVHAKNLSLIQQFIESSPILIVQSLRAEPAEWLGVRWLLPQISENQQSLIQKFLGEDRLLEIATVARISDFEPRSWLQGLVERIILKRMGGKNGVESILGRDRVVQLLLTPNEFLRETTLKMGTAGAWRVLLEVTPQGQLEEFLVSQSVTQLSLLVASADVSDQQIQEAADELIRRVDPTLILKGQKKAQEIKYYSQTLLDPIITSVLSQTLGHEGVILEPLKKASPELFELVMSKIWPPERLDLVPNSVLLDYFKAVSHEHKAAMIVAMPEAQSARLQGFLQAGNVSTIVLDLVKKMKTRNQLAELEDAQGISRQFLDYLRVQARAGKFETLKSEADLQAEAA